MPKIKLNLDTIRFINIFESVTGAKVKDCIPSTAGFIFIVQEGEIAKAIGKKGSNIRRIEGMLKKRVRVIEYNSNIQQCIMNFIHPLKLNNIEEDSEKKIITLEAIDSKTRGMLIGRNASNLREYESIIQRYFDIIELKVK